MTTMNKAIVYKSITCSPIAEWSPDRSQSVVITKSINEEAYNTFRSAVLSGEILQVSNGKSASNKKIVYLYPCVNPSHGAIPFGAGNYHSIFIAEAGVAFVKIIVTNTEISMTYSSIYSSDGEIK